MGVLATQEQIGQAVDEMAGKILAAEYSNPLFLALLNGSAPFAVDLMRSIQRQSADDFYPTLRYMHTSTYDDGNEARKPVIHYDTLGKTALKDHTIIVLDDVLDTGVTFAEVRRNLFERGVEEDRLKFAVLAQKDVPRAPDVAADFVGFDFANVWLYGAGLNGIPGEPNAEAGRFTPDICAAD